MTDRVEIRLNRGRAIFMVCYIIIALGGINAFTYYTTSYQENPFFVMLVVVLNGVFIYNLYKLVIRISKNEPVLILTSNDITTNYRGITSIHRWSEIKQLEIHTTGRFRHILIDSGNGPTKTDITGLEKQPHEVETLVGKYQKAAN
jgi:hypothetical protein